MISSTCILPIPNIAMIEFVFKCRNILINILSVVIAWHVFGRIYCRTKLLSVHGLFDLQTNNCNLLNVTVCSVINIISAAETFINIIFFPFQSHVSNQLIANKIKFARELKICYISHLLLIFVAFSTFDIWTISKIIHYH